MVRSPSRRSRAPPSACCPAPVAILTGRRSTPRSLRHCSPAKTQAPASCYLYEALKMSLYSDYYFNSNPSVAELDMLEIEHFRFSPTIFRLTRNGNIQDITGTDAFGNPRRGCIVTHEGPAGPFEYEYVPMQIE